MALAKAKLMRLAKEATEAPGPTEQISNAVSNVVRTGSTAVRKNPWRGVAVAMGIGLALGITRGRPLRAVGAVLLPVAGTLGTSLSASVARTVETMAPQVAAQLGAATSKLLARASGRSASR